MEISTPPRSPPLPPPLNVCVFCWTNCLGATVRMIASCQPGHRDYRFKSTIRLTAADRRNPNGNWSSCPPDPCLPPPPPGASPNPTWLRFRNPRPDSRDKLEERREMSSASSIRTTMASVVQGSHKVANGTCNQTPAPLPHTTDMLTVLICYL